MNISVIIQSRFTTVLIPFLYSIYLTSQVKTDANISFVNQNIWRGKYQAGVSIQPEVNFSYKDWNFQVWGTSDSDTEEKEIDLSIGYDINNFKVGLTDYWFGGITDAYLRNHVLENNITYTVAGIPLILEWNTVLVGGDNSFSAFQRISYSPEWNGCEYEFSIGCSPWKNNFLGSKRFAINELKASISKEIGIIQNFRLCFGSSLIYNPYSDNLFFACQIRTPLSF